jgi:hypothetical protein
LRASFIVSALRAQKPQKVITIMCEQLTILARYTAACYVAQCEHTTIHLCWEHLSVHLCPLDFLTLTHTVADVCARQSASNGKMRLGIGTLTLELLPDDYHPMIALMQRAAVQLQSMSAPLLESGKQRFLLSAGQCLN